MYVRFNSDEMNSYQVCMGNVLRLALIDLLLHSMFISVKDLTR